jgi:putative transposase
VLDRASAGWRGLTMTPAGLRLLQDLRHQLLDRPTASRRRRDPQHADHVAATAPETVAAAA